MKNIKVMYVDDDVCNLPLIRLYLEKDVVECETYSNPEEALALIDESFDLLITDFDMPEMNGVDLVAKAKEKFPDLPMIIFSGNTFGVHEAMKDHPYKSIFKYVDVVCKSGGMNSLVDTINEILKEN